MEFTRCFGAKDEGEFRRRGKKQKEGWPGARPDGVAHRAHEPANHVTVCDPAGPGPRRHNPHFRTGDMLAA